ncbi:threonine ammonia-lyase, biosynthetic [Pseudidiomarina sp. YC-516-91]|uniref:threonine ammonia-lyase, biosynthetic n=1 Tax=Pseudidiomarina salilacus TaxID=3384452 RepID=UPI003984A9B9
MSEFTSVEAMKAHYLRQILLAPVYQAAVETPLQQMPKLSKRLQHQVLLKREDQQPIYSFKLRGAFNKLHQLQQQGVQGVICASAGNHAQGVAYSAKQLGLHAVVVMPVTTAEIKVSAVRDRGAEVILHGVDFDSASDFAHQLAAERKLSYVPPFDDDAVIAGQGTVAKEMLAQQHFDAVFVPVGGGGLLAGMAAYIKSICPEIKVIGVEPADAASLTAALAARYPLKLKQVGLFADGTAVKQVGTLPFTVAAALCDEVITVSSDEICAAVKDIFDDARAIAEPAGALALAGLKVYARRAEVKPGLRLATVLSGANLNFDRLRYIVERSEIGELREALLAVTIAERVGSFRRFCEVLNGRVITEFNYRYADDQQAQIFVGLKLTDGLHELNEVKQLLAQAGYAFVDLSQDELAKQHIRHMVGGRPRQPLQERLFQVTFPEHPQALSDFLQALGDSANISLFHYRNHGAAYGDVLVGFGGVAAATASASELQHMLQQLGYPFVDVTAQPSYQFFLAHADKAHTVKAHTVKENGINQGTVVARSFS